MTIWKLIQSTGKYFYLAMFWVIVMSSCLVTNGYLFTYLGQSLIEKNYLSMVYLQIGGLVSFFMYIFLYYIFQLHVNKVIKAALLTYRTNIVLQAKASDTAIDSSNFISFLNNDTKQIEAGIRSQFDIVENLTTGICCLIGLAFLNIYMALIAIGSFFLARFFGSFTHKISKANEIKRSENRNTFLKRSSDLLNGFQVFDVYNRQKAFVKQLSNASNDFEETSRDIRNKSDKIRMLSNQNTVLSFLINVGASFALIHKGLALPGLFVSSTVFTGPISEGLYIITNSNATIAGINEVLSKRFKEIPIQDTSIKELTNFDLVIKNLEFSYDEKQVLTNTNLTFEEGKKYMIIGASGSGKSTLLKLISKQLSPNNGDLLLGNTSYQDLNATSIHTYIGYVHQDPYMFKASINDNITLHATVAPNTLEEAISKSNVKDFCNNLDQVLEANGDNLSGGQKQRIAIARELVADHKIILFDEVNSSLDKQLNVSLVETLVNLDQTILFVTHNYDAYTSSLFDEVIDLTSSA